MRIKKNIVKYHTSIYSSYHNNHKTRFLYIYYRHALMRIKKKT